MMILPIKNVSTLCSIDSGRLSPGATIPGLAPFPHRLTGLHLLEQAWNGPAGLLAYVRPTDEFDEVAVARVDGEMNLAHVRTLARRGFEPACLLFRDGLLFVGGGGKNGAEFGFYDLDRATPEWNPIPLPDDCMPFGCRCIDDILIDGDRIVAVDNVVVPKYLIYYANDGAGRYVTDRVHMLRCPWTYATVVEASMSADWLAILYHSDGAYCYGNYISLLDPRGLGEYATLRSDFRPSREWHSIALHGRRLLVAAGTEGLGISAPLGAFRRPDEPMAPMSRESKPPTPEHLRYSQEISDSIRFFSPRFWVAESVTGVVVGPDGSTLVVVVKSKDGYDSHAIDFDFLTVEIGPRHG